MCFLVFLQWHMYLKIESSYDILPGLCLQEEWLASFQEVYSLCRFVCTYYLLADLCTCKLSVSCIFQDSKNKFRQQDPRWQKAVSNVNVKNMPVSFQVIKICLCVTRRTGCSFRLIISFPRTAGTNCSLYANMESWRSNGCSVSCGWERAVQHLFSAVA